MKKVANGTKFNGLNYNIIFVHESFMGEDDGSCDHPEFKKRFIRIKKTLKNKKKLETAIHEMIHACCWFFAEEKVEKMAKEISNALWKLGVRFKDE